MKKRIVSIILALFLTVSLIPSGIVAQAATVRQETEATYYFRDQLKTEASKLFYEAMEKMLADDTFKSGVDAIEISADTELSTKYKVQELCAGHANGSVNLINEYGAGRDAFYADHPEVFYVDFSALTVRITKTSNGEFHLYLGAGRYPTYYTEGFTSEDEVDKAIKEYENAFDAMIKATSSAGGDKEKVTAVHDYLTKHVTYRDELSVSNPENMGFIRTAYGALVVQEGVCESYTRAFKAAMDYYGIPCVMVSGVYRHSDKIYEAHIWDEVKIDGKWYAVDVTMDDPVNPKKTKSDPLGVDGYENTEYLLVGEEVMRVHHVADGAMSPGGYEFTYPMIGTDLETITAEDSPLQVRYKKDVYDQEIAEGGVYYVSYMGMNATEMKENGYYLLMRNRVYDVERGWFDTDWYYYTPEIYVGYEDYTDVGDETMFKMPHVEYIEFGVTLDPYPPITPDKVPDLFFHGDDTLLLARSGLLHNEAGTYRAAPASLHGEPAYNRCSIGLGENVHLVAYFNDILVTPEVYEQWCATEKVGQPGYEEAIRSATADDFNLEVYVQDGFVGRNDNNPIYQVMQDIQISFVDNVGPNHITETKIEFNYKTSDLWIDDNIAYTFFLTGLVGAYSGKTPGSFSWVVQAPCAICAYRSQGFDYNTFAKPVLVADEDLSMDGWTDSDGNPWESTPWDDMYRNKLMLVVEDSSTKEANELENMVEEDGEDVLSALTYNINLSLCKKQWANLKDGMSVRIQLGFPVGYGPDDAGVTFKAYHFIKNPETGAIIDIEEIPCTITPYGLLIEVHSFSPFAICAVESKPEDKVEKTVVLMSDVGGKITADKDGSMITLKEGDQVTITVTPDADYVIDKVEASSTKVCNYSSEANSNSYTFTIKYDDIVDGAISSVVSASFVTAAVAAEEEGDALIPVAVAPEAAIITAPDKTSPIGDVTLSVVNPNESYVYNWYKVTGSDSVYVGSGSTLTLYGIDSMGRFSDNAGTYYCVVVAIAGATTASSKPSETVSVVRNVYIPDAFSLESSPAVDGTGTVTVVEGDSVVISVPEPNESCEYIWHKVVNGVDTVVRNITSATYSLVLNPISKEMEGKYYCVEKNALGSEDSTNSITVKVNPAPPAEFYITGLTDVKAGENLTLSVNRPDENLTYTWYKVNLEDESREAVGVGPELVLIGRDAEGNTVDISGVYVCVALDPKTELTTESKNSITVTVIPLAEIADFEIKAEGMVDNTVSVKEGVEVTLTVDAVEGQTYTWYKEGTEASVKEGTEYTFVANAETAGVYYCIATNEDKVTKESLNRVTVAIIPPAEIADFEIKAEGMVDNTVSVKEGVEVTLTVDAVEGQTYAWYKEGTEASVKEGTEYTFVANAETAGVYYCIATNEDKVTKESLNRVTVAIIPPAEIADFEIKAAGMVDNTVSVKEGVEVTLTVDAVEGQTYAWYKEGTEASVKEGTEYTFVANAETAGVYYCIATNEDKVTKASSNKVTVAIIPPAEIADFEIKAAGMVDNTVSVKEGVEVTLTVDAVEGQTYTWYKEGTEASVKEGTEYTFVANAETAGVYYCIATNEDKVTKESLNRVTVEIIPPAEIADFEIKAAGMVDNTVSVKEGVEVTLTVDAVEGQTYTWYKEGTEASIGEGLTYTLVANAETAGVYYCIATNEDKVTKESANRVTVAIIPPAEIADFEIKAAGMVDNTVSVKEGVEVTLTVDAVEGQTYAWYKEGTEAAIGEGTTYTLVANAETAGVYYCIATNEDKVTKESANRVTVAIIPPAEIADFEIKAAGMVDNTVSVKEGVEVILTVDAVEGQTYAWYKEGTEASIGDGTEYTFVANAETAGVYYCIATNEDKVTKESLNRVTVEIIPPAEIADFEIKAAGMVDNTVSVKEGVEVTLTVDAVEGQTYTWYKEGTEASIGSGTAYTLVANAETAGVYYCVATNEDKVTKASSNKVTVAIIPPAEIADFEIKAAGMVDDTISVKEGVEVTLTVDAVEGQTYTWYKEGTEAAVGEGTTYTLVANAETAGVYYCIATNEDKVTKESANRVTVEIIPPAEIADFEIKAEGMVDNTVSVKEGVEVTLTVDAVEGQTYTWYKEGTETAIGSGTTYTLVANAETAGIYYCIATNEDKVTKASSNKVTLVIVKDEPTVEPGFGFSANGKDVSPDTTVELGVGEGLTLSVGAVEGYTYEWYRKGVNGSADVLVGTGATVALSAVDGYGNAVDLSGDYYCVAVKDADRVASIIAHVNAAQPPFIAPPAPHQHILGPWEYNDVSHWIGCVTCGMIVDVAPHTFDDEGHCVYCGYIDRNFEIPGVEEEPDTLVVVETPTEAPATEDDPEETPDDIDVSEPDAEPDVAEENPKTGLFLSPFAAIAATAILALRRR